jgi:hypothetical protein
MEALPASTRSIMRKSFNRNIKATDELLSLPLVNINKTTTM